MLPFGTSRRRFLSQSTFGVGGVAFAWMLQQEGLLAAPPKPELEPSHFDLTPKPPHFEPKAKAMISLFMQGGPSHMDLLDPKPLLNQRNGEAYGGDLKIDNAAEASRTIMGSPWKFTKCGQSGIEVSELLPHLGRVIDDVCVIRSMASGSNNHGPGIYAMNTGREQRGMPTLGSWLTYGLGSVNQNLPGFVVLTDPDGLPVLGVDNWWNGTYGFSMWLAGGGIKGGQTYGATDEFGHKTVEKPVTPHDYHVTLLHLFGLDPKRLVFRQGPRELALVEGAGQVLKGILG
jgi:hypothetical protein